MQRTVRGAVAALATIVATSVLVGVPGADAAPAPELSVSEGAPGTVLEVRVPDCVSDEATGDYRFAQVLLISGAAPGGRLAGAAGGDDAGVARLVVPDWVDPDAPARVEAVCIALDDVGEGLVVTEHDPAPFDVLPGDGPSTQTRTFDRTSLWSGQGFRVTGSGCDLPGAEYAGVAVFAESEATGAYLEPVAIGDAAMDGTGYTVPVVLAGSGMLGFSAEREGPDGPVELEVWEEHEAIPPGTYTAVAFCGGTGGESLIYEPQQIVVTGVAPVDAVDLTAAEGSSVVTLAGAECTSGPVELWLEAGSLDDFFEWDGLEAPAIVAGEALAAARRQGRAFASPVPDAPSWVDAVRTGPSRSTGRAARALADEGYVEATVEPDAAGDWSFADDAGFDLGFASGSAQCGDPFGEGWVYATQAVAVEAAQAPPPSTSTSTTSTPTTPGPAVVPPARPADAVTGRPRYAG